MRPLLKKTALSLMLAFSGAVGADTPSLPQKAGEEETLWRTEYLDTVLALRPCPETGVCGYVYWVNPKDRKIYNYLADPEDKKKNNRQTQRRSQRYRPTEEDILKVCGHAPRMRFNQIAADRWGGKLELRGANITVDVDVTVLSDSELKVVSSKAFFKKKEKWTRVEKNDPRFPKCIAPE
jgi:hypothetical protein